MILCLCTGLTDRALERLLRSGVRSVAELARTTGAGATCGPCRAALAAQLRGAAGRPGEAGGALPPQEAR